MNIKDQIRAELVILKVALQAKKAPSTVRRDMQDVIDIAWQSDDPATIAMQLRKFPAGKPTVEEFMIELSKHH